MKNILEIMKEIHQGFFCTSFNLYYLCSYKKILMSFF